MSAAMSTRKGCDCGTQPTRQHWLNIDGCGLFCALIVYFLVLFGMYATTYAVIYPVFGFHSLAGGVHLIIYNGISVLAIYCHLKAMTTDPGIFPNLNSNSRIFIHSSMLSLIHSFNHLCTY